jgi:hypothetical protein
MVNSYAYLIPVVPDPIIGLAMALAGGGCIFIYLCSARRISFESDFFTVCEHEYMNIHPTPHPQLSCLATALPEATQDTEHWGTPWVERYGSNDPNSNVIKPTIFEIGGVCINILFHSKCMAAWQIVKKHTIKTGTSIGSQWGRSRHPPKNVTDWASASQQDIMVYLKIFI